MSKRNCKDCIWFAPSGSYCVSFDKEIYGIKNHLCPRYVEKGNIEDKKKVLIKIIERIAS